MEIRKVNGDEVQSNLQYIPLSVYRLPPNTTVHSQVKNMFFSNSIPPVAWAAVLGGEVHCTPPSLNLSGVGSTKCRATTVRDSYTSYVGKSTIMAHTVRITDMVWWKFLNRTLHFFLFLLIPVISGRYMQSRVAELTGCAPHLVFMNLARLKMDPNR